MSDMNAADISMEEVDGRVIRVARWRASDRRQEAPPLLFFNGIGANIELMAPLAARMPERDILTFDMPGVGGSPEPVLPYRAWMMARIASLLLDRFDYAKADVMGVSWGGAMAQQFAFQHAGQVNRLVLAATSAGMVMVPGKFEALAKMADPRRYIDPDFMRKHFKTLYGGSEDGAHGHIERIEPPSKRGYYYQIGAMLGWTSVPFLPFLGAKTLILMGDDDQIVPVANGYILESLIPDARLEIIEGGGHLFLVSQAERTIPAIQSFLDRNPAGAGRKSRKRAA